MVLARAITINNATKPTIIFLMGPTGCGKTKLAIECVQRLPCEIISVDSAMVYRGMDIGTAKPTAAELALAPHRLIDICDPNEPYSAGQFCEDAMQHIQQIHASGKLPLLVGGTMLYFRLLERGIAALPTQDPAIRAEITQIAQQQGWPALHAELVRVDPQSARHIHPNDGQRIQRALEVYRATGQPLSTLQASNAQQPLPYAILHLIIAPQDRSVLHQRIAQRFEVMLQADLLAEVAALMQQELGAELPAMRMVGYRQALAYLQGACDYDSMCERALAATRQLAKRQWTWLRSWPNGLWFDSEDSKLVDRVTETIKKLAIPA